MPTFNSENKENKIEIFQTADNKTEIKVKFEQETVWLTQKQLVVLFNSSKANISEHIKHIFETKELDKISTVRNFQTVQKVRHKNYIKN